MVFTAPIRAATRCWAASSRPAGFVRADVAAVQTIPGNVSGAAPLKVGGGFNVGAAILPPQPPVQDATARNGLELLQRLLLFAGERERGGDLVRGHAAPLPWGEGQGEATQPMGWAITAGPATRPFCSCIQIVNPPNEPLAVLRLPAARPGCAGLAGSASQAAMARSSPAVGLPAMGFSTAAWPRAGTRPPNAPPPSPNT